MGGFIWQPTNQQRHKRQQHNKMEFIVNNSNNNNNNNNQSITNKLNEKLSPFDVVIRAPVPPQFAETLNEEALIFVGKLHKLFENRRQELLRRRVEREQRLAQGEMPGFLDETEHIRRDPNWKLLPVSNTKSPILRRVVDVVCWRVFDFDFFNKLLDSSADGIQFDFDDSYSPTWQNNLNAHRNLVYFIQNQRIKNKSIMMLVRPRSLNLPEKHIFVNGQPTAGAFFDFGVWVHNYYYYYHYHYHHHRNGDMRNDEWSKNDKEGPYLYIPKIENHLEARFWNDMIDFTEVEYKVPKGTIKTIVHIENILAAFEMEEILYELREHCLGLNSGRWDYVFSFIKKFRHRKDFVTPDRTEITVEQQTFLATWEKLLVDTCKKRGGIATGGMAPQLFGDYSKRNNLEQQQQQQQQQLSILRYQVWEAKQRECKVGLDGALVADPIFVEVVFEAFKERPIHSFFHLLDRSVDRAMWEKQLSSMLLEVPKGSITMNGVEKNVSVALHYIQSWINGEGGCPLNGNLEDLATAEISRAQLWQWLKHGAKTNTGQKVDIDLVRQKVDELLMKKKEILGNERFAKSKFSIARELLLKLLDTHTFIDFMPTLLYDWIVDMQVQSKL
jgi:malate synthase